MNHRLDCNECPGLSVDLENPKPYLCMYDDHWSMSLEDLPDNCYKKKLEEK